LTTAPSPDRLAQQAVPTVATGGFGNRRGLLLGLLLVAAYIASGRLGLLLAVPPGYATAIFPAAGIAAAAMLIAGPASLPWTFLGSFALNVWIGSAAGTGAVTAWLAAALIAAASTGQAGLTGWALRRMVGYPCALDNAPHVWRFLLLTPLCCLTSATLSVSGLWGLGVIAAGSIATSWPAWWIGDTLGVLVVLPLILVLAGEPRPLWRARLVPVALPMLLFFGLFVVMFVRVSAWERNAQLLEFRLVSQQAVDKIRTRLDEQEVFLTQLKSSFGTMPPIGRSDFATLVDAMLQRFPMIQAIEWAPRVNRDARSRFEAAQHADFPGFAIREIGPGRTLRPAGDRAAFYPVTYVVPARGNAVALGLDLASNPDRNKAVVRALTTDELSATGPIHLVQEPEQQVGLLLLLAVPSGANGPGLLLVALRAGSFVEASLLGMGSILRFRLVDSARHQPLYDSLGIAAHPRYTQQFDFGQRRYVVETAPTSSYLARTRGWESWGLLSAGVFGTGLLGALLLLSTGYARRIEAQVEARTRDLAAANRQLRIEIEERHNAEAALRQAQRMEAIGRLTGGIAHDFNNLLTVVTANAELLGNELQGQPLQRRAAAILRAAGRGERLTRQLLGFSRRQALRPEAVDLRQRTAEIAEMLAQAVGPEIELRLDLPEGLWPVAIDPAEFDLAILNIALNARDAMPAGGRFIVAAQNRSIVPGDPGGDGLAGDFVGLTFTDAGCGMPPEVIAHAFDPYFTTKDVGAGSGLGLSQVYGFARQSGGGATLASTPDAGTTVTLLLPRAGT
jgi:signal transduction histidine kinase